MAAGLPRRRTGRPSPDTASGARRSARRSACCWPSPSLAAAPAGARTAALQQDRATARALAAEIAGLDAQIGAAVTKYSQATRALEAVRGQIKHNQRQQRLAYKELGVARATLAARAVAMYKHGDVTAVDAMFTADDFSELVTDLTMVRTLARSRPRRAAHRRDHQARARRPGQDPGGGREDQAEARRDVQGRARHHPRAAGRAPRRPRRRALGHPPARGRRRHAVARSPRPTVEPSAAGRRRRRRVRPVVVAHPGRRVAATASAPGACTGS